MSRTKRRWIELNPKRENDFLSAKDITYAEYEGDGPGTGSTDIAHYGGKAPTIEYDLTSIPSPDADSTVEDVRTIEAELDLKVYAPENTTDRGIIIFKGDVTGWPTDVSTGLQDRTKLKKSLDSAMYLKKYAREHVDDSSDLSPSNAWTNLTSSWTDLSGSTSDLFVPSERRILKWTRDYMGFVRGPGAPSNDPDTPEETQTRTAQMELAAFDLGRTDPNASDFATTSGCVLYNSSTKTAGRFLKRSGLFVNKDNTSCLASFDRNFVVPSEKAIRETQEWIRLKNLSDECRYVQRDFHFTGSFLLQNNWNGSSSIPHSGSISERDLIRGVMGTSFFWRLPRGKIYADASPATTKGIWSNIVNGTSYSFSLYRIRGVTEDLICTLSRSASDTPTQYSGDILSGVPTPADRVFIEGDRIAIVNNTSASINFKNLLVTLKFEILGETLT
ncbi:MAG TPA: hypothetical protein PLA71_00480 [Saccharofermentans sp.]|nr:hypothetical protein [Saccharofermentans sp.]